MVPRHTQDRILPVFERCCPVGGRPPMALEASWFGGGAHQIIMLRKAGEAEVGLIFDTGTAIESPGNGVSFGLESADLDGLATSLKSKGCPVSGPVLPNPHVRFFFVKDPDSYTAQLVEQA